MNALKKDVVLTIVGTQEADGEQEQVELTTTGRYYKRGGLYYISYDESESTGFEDSKTTLKVEAEKVTMLRMGKSRAQMVVEKGRRHQCFYDMGFGAMTIGISGNRFESSLSDKGGRLEFGYTMDINTAVASENTVVINVKECES